MNTSIHFENGHGCVDLYRGTEKFTIANLFVMKSDRKRGYGTELLHAAITEFNHENLYAKGRLQLTLRVLRDSWVEEWYEREGFQRHCDDAVDERYVWMIFQDK